MTNKEAIEVLKGIYPDGAYSKTEGRHLKAINIAIAALANTQEMTEALRTEYEKGRYDMREEMMKEAVVTDVLGHCSGWLHFGYVPECDYDFKQGDKVKLIIIKED